MKRRLLIMITICVFLTILVGILSTQFFYVFDDGIFPIAIHSKTDIYRLENTSDQLRGIFANCVCQEKIKGNPETNNPCTQTLIDWENSTHYIDNNLCKFITLEEHDEGFTELRISGNLAQEICSITGGECPSSYPANPQKDGSAIVLTTTWDVNTKIEKSFSFTIKNNTLSYDVRENEN